MSMPFVNREFTFTQPDGSTLSVRGSGNQEAATFETLDGFTVVRDPVSRFYHYARMGPGGRLEAAGVRAGATDPRQIGLEAGLRPAPAPGAELPPPAMEGLSDEGSRWRQRRREHRQALQMSVLAEAEGFRFAPPARPTVGTFVGLTLLIDFADHPATISRQEVDDFCNRPGYTGYGNNGSVRDYFLEVSGGRLDYSNIVTPYYRARHDRSYYTNEAVPFGQRARELIREALDHLVANEFDASALTSDDQDYVFAVNVFYAGATNNNWSQGLWPHASYLAPNGNRLAPGKIAHDYQVTDMTSELTLGTFCHENGHLICDFPDLYDYGRDGVNSSGVGIFCLMCAGGSGAAKKNPAQVGAYLKHSAGWTGDLADLVPGRITLTAANNEFALLRKNATEYFILENRDATGRDSILGTSGLAVWHVDELGSNENQRGSSASHYECALIQADGLRELERGIDFGDDQDLFRQGHRDAFSAATVPASNWWDASPSGLDIGQIGAAGPAMTFTVR